MENLACVVANKLSRRWSSSSMETQTIINRNCCADIHTITLNAMLDIFTFLFYKGLSLHYDWSGPHRASLSRFSLNTRDQDFCHILCFMWMRFQVITSTLPVSIFVNLMERDIVTVKSAFEARLDPGPLQITALAFTVYLEPVNLAEGETKKGSSHSVWTKKSTIPSACRTVW